MFSWNEFYYPETSSTNEDAKKLITDGVIKKETVIWSEKQTQGKGRYDRVWDSPQGNLYSSFVIKNENASYLSFTTALSVIHTLEKLGVTGEIACKWPNDVLVDGKKISGILLEVCDDYLIIGIGINIIACPQIASYKTTSIKDFNAEPSAKEVLDVLSEMLAKNIKILQKEGFASIRKNWLHYAYAIGEKIQVNMINESTTGIFTGISEQGALLLQTEKEIRKIMAGDVFYL